MADVFGDLDCCDVCGEDHLTEACPELGLNEVKVEILETTTRARLTLPGFLQVVDNSEGLIGVIAKEDIPQKTQLGPYEAKRTTHIFEDQGFYTLKLIAKDGSTVCLDTTDETECNWMCLVRAAVSTETQNCMAYQLGSNIFYNTTCHISKGQELQVWYAPHYAKKLGKLPAPDGQTKVLLGHRIEPLFPEPGAGGEGPADRGKQGPLEGEGDDFRDTSFSDMQDGTTGPHTTGEIRPAHWCPRCGNTFPSQALMVLHLREHIIPATSRTKKPQVLPKRGRGRPRKNVTASVAPTAPTGVKRGRGRPRKSEVIRAVKEEEVVSSDSEKESEDEGETAAKIAKQFNSELVIDDEGDFDYTPVKAVPLPNSRQRVQPSRSRKGQTSRYSDSYVTHSITKVIMSEQSEDRATAREAKSPSVSTAASDSTITPGQGQVKVKRGRGRPRKIPVVIVETERVTPVNVIDRLDKEKFETLLSEVDHQTDDKGTSHSETEAEAGKQPEEILEPSSEQVVLQEGTEQLIEEQDRNLVQPEETENMETTDGSVAENSPVSEEVPETAGDNLEPSSVEHSFSMKLTQTDEAGTDDDEGENDNESPEDGEPDSSRVENESDFIEVVPKDTLEAEGVSTPVLYRCKICLKTFLKMNYLKLHLPQHTDQYKCEKCGKRFTRQGNLQNHVCVVEKKQELEQLYKKFVTEVREEDVTAYTCQCKETFMDKAEALQHCEKHLEDNICSMCGDDFETRKDMMVHVCAADGEEFACDICKQAFKTAKYLYRHMAMHTDIFRCEKCRKCFSRKDSLQKHVLKCCPEMAESYNIFSCNTCAKVFSTRTGKKNHMLKCQSSKCQSCRRVFASVEDLEEHECSENDIVEESINSVEYSCSKCGKAFLSLAYLNKHKLIHEGKHVCQFCNKSFASKEDCGEHENICKQVKTIKSGGTGVCDKCNEVFYKAKHFREHYLTHTHPYSCEKCLKRFVKVGTLKSHVCSGLGLRYSCQVCQKSFTCQRFLDRHMLLHGEPKYHCSACEQDFHKKDMFNDHHCKDEEGNVVRVVRTQGQLQIVEKYMCETCGKSFVSKSNMTKHMISHGEKMCECEQCGKRFHYENYLKEHISSVHMKIYKFQCSHCGKLLKSKTGLISHVKQFHTKTHEVYNCPVCQKAFRQKGNMKTHMFSHEKGRKFVCQYCGKNFKYPDQLNRHRLVHTMVNKLQCDQCEKKFCKPYELKKHIMVFHSGYVYVCGICFARCGHRHTLVRHYKRKHPGHKELLEEDGYINSLLKHSSDLQEESPHEEQVVQMTAPQQPHIILDNNFSGLFRTQETIVLPGGAIVPHEEAEALHSLSNVAISTAHLSELKEGTLLKTEAEIVSGDFVPKSQMLIQNSNLDTSQADVESVTQKIVAAQQVLATETAVGGGSGEIGVVANSDGTIRINGEDVSIQSLQDMPQSLEGLEGAEGQQIVILQIMDGTVTDQATGEAIQVQNLQGEAIQVQDIGALENLEVQTTVT